jgi:hypothetical protein
MGISAGDSRRRFVIKQRVTAVAKGATEASHALPGNLQL